MKNKIKVIIQILCIISLVITAFSIRNTYAKYYEKRNTNYSTNIKKWVIQLNNYDILEETDISKIIEPTFETDENVNDGVLVPGRIGYFDLVVDYTYVDVSFTMDCTIQSQEETELTDLEIYGYAIVDDSGNETMQDSTEIHQIINVEEEGSKQKRLKIYFRWNDDQDNQMDDMADTMFKGAEQDGSDHTALKYLVNITFNQLNETADENEPEQIT